MQDRRSRAWRRHQRARHVAKRANSAPFRRKSPGHFSKARPIPCYGKLYSDEKRWKDMYTRAAKLIRAKQLGFPYPRRAETIGEYSVRV